MVIQASRWRACSAGVSCGFQPIAVGYNNNSAPAKAIKRAASGYH